MALIWQEASGGRRFEVRSHGSVRRLYIGGVLHTSHHPHQIFTGDVWDLLALGSFYAPRSKRPRFLVLGVGGGRVIHCLLKLWPGCQITAVDLEPLCPKIAAQFFDLDTDAVTFVTEDGRSFVDSYRGGSFDYIIDDMFLEEEGEPARVQSLSNKWTEALRSLLGPGGCLCFNFPDRPSLSKDWAQLSFKESPGLYGEYVTGGRFQNAVLFMPDKEPPRGQLRRLAGSHPLLKGGDQSRLNFHRRRLSSL